MAIDDDAPKTRAEFIAEVQEEDEGEVLVSLNGELDLSNAGALRELLVSPVVLDARGVRISLREVTFIDSSIIGMLVTACKRIRRAGATFSLLCEPGTARRTLEIAGLLEFFDVDGTC